MVILVEWKKISPLICQRLVNNLSKRIEEVIKHKGEIIKLLIDLNIKIINVNIHKQSVIYFIIYSKI